MGLRKLGSLAVAAIAVVACTSVAPQASPASSFSVAITPLSSAAPSLTAASLPASVAPASVPPTAEPPASEVPSATPTAPPTAPPTPKPTKKPTPTPSPTPTPIAGDIEVAFLDTSIPDPFYDNTDYTITVYISALGTTDLPNVHGKLVVQNEAVTVEFDTGPIAYGDTYTRNIPINVPAMGPSALILTGKMPAGYADTNKANNIKTVGIEVLPAP